MDSIQVFSNRFASLRIKSGMTQQEWAHDFSDYIDRDKNYTLMTISQWESGSKLPPLFAAINIAKYFHVSMDWLIGLTDDETGTIQESNTDYQQSATEMEANLIIKDDQVKGFDKQPVYVVFDNKDLPNRWGILDWRKDRIVFSDGLMSLKNGMRFTLYANIPDAERSPKYNVRKPLSMSQLRKKKHGDKVWVEMKSMDGIVKAKYNGWYKFNSTTNCLENIMGFVLPIDGMSISYDVFSSEG